MENFPGKEKSDAERLAEFEKTLDPRAVIDQLKQRIQELGGLSPDERSQRSLDRNLPELKRIRRSIESVQEQFAQYLHERDKIVSRSSFIDLEVAEAKIILKNLEDQASKRIEEAETGLEA